MFPILSLKIEKKNKMLKNYIAYTSMFPYTAYTPFSFKISRTFTSVPW